MIRQRTKFDLISGGELWIVVTATDAGQSREYFGSINVEQREQLDGWYRGGGVDAIPPFLVITPSADPARYCERTGKIRFATPADASCARKSSKLRAIRTYQCRYCHGWHMTRQLQDRKAAARHRGRPR